MKFINKVIFLLGLLAIIFAFVSLLTGEAPSLGAGGNSAMVAMNSHPFHFWLSIIILIIFGVLLIKGSIDNTTSVKNKSTKPFDIDLNR
ncbi:MAG: hypothetical protein AAF372_03105, partial [Pseudomonadota bacterium]